ncbi:MAG: NUDIX domain-containing protein [Candidatus Magasanikbacteria bacterium]|jgi:8-oxo-dGTP diphosphatase|nr:NUDIX domain-containing protein [Candidatus Magasanikbacteria bacterium]MBT4072036.1 NUDIX domain-containing protein [Candidatus Magasanikbacteria bacterium]
MTKKDIPLHVVFVEAWIKKDGKYLLAKRSSKDDQAAGKWAVPGGKVDMELESNIIENSLEREVMEEVGIKVTNPRFFFSGSFIRSSGHHVVGLSFLLDYESGEARPLEDQDEIRWVTFEEMDVLLDDHWDDLLKHLKALELKN